MKPPSIFVLVLLFALVLNPVPVAAQGPATDNPVQANIARGAADDDPVTLRINLLTDPPTLDPALAGDSVSTMVIEQLFIGLVDIDDTTAEIQPELATSWTPSADRTVITFTLRDDATWSDGSPITAEDVRYGILRTLNPATGSLNARSLDVIRNAEAFRTGAITDENQVGVEALSAASLRITLEYPAAHALSLLGLWYARPMPRAAIEAHGSPDWTLPANIVTSGPYKLSEWVNDDHIVLDKYDGYFDAGNVQIEQIRMVMVDDVTAWPMYQNGELDTTAAPPQAVLDPVLAQSVRIQPTPCTYFFGFNASQPPFDKALVRKAFSAATDRQGLINNITGGVQKPAVTLTPPGMFGYVDGIAEGVGLPYAPVQAQQWLSDAGYPGGQGLPPITLWHNTSDAHRAIARYVADSWRNTLGVDVTLSDVAWGEYLNRLADGEFGVWRMGWCADYLDGYNFLYDAIASNRGGFGAWDSESYDEVLSQIVRELDAGNRQELMKQAEEILVETDAVMLPVYHYASMTVCQAYLERTYPASHPDIATWRITRTTGTATAATGGEVTSHAGDTAIQIPAGAVTDTVDITFTPAYGTPPDGNLAGIGRTFDITAVYSGTTTAAHLAPGQSYTVVVEYEDSEVSLVDEDTLALYWWDGDAWTQQGIESAVNTANNIVTAEVNHFSVFSVLGETERVHLPALLDTD